MRGCETGVATAWAAAGLIVAAPSAAAGGTAAEKEGKKPGGPPPLVVDEDAPALPGETAKKGPRDRPSPSAADNSACFVCHANFKEESLAASHAKAKVGCVGCHGESTAHRNDEDNVTPPDIMFAKTKIDAACQECHDSHDAPAAKVIARWQQRCPAKSNPKEIVCTDCHGEHQMQVRTVRWDKQTRKLLLSPSAKKN